VPAPSYRGPYDRKGDQQEQQGGRAREPAEEERDRQSPDERPTVFADPQFTRPSVFRRRLEVLGLRPPCGDLGVSHLVDSLTPGATYGAWV
jgi:hypothetical protein